MTVTCGPDTHGEANKEIDCSHTCEKTNKETNVSQKDGGNTIVFKEV